MNRVAVALFTVLAASSVYAQESYKVTGTQVEGCECKSVCPCAFQGDATEMECRGLLFWNVAEGRYGKIDLKGVMFAAALTKSGKNIEKALGKWEGILYISDKATKEQMKAVEAIVKDQFGPAFGKLEVKTAPIEIKCAGDHQEAMIGKIGSLKITGIKGANGKITVIENAPSPLVLPMNYCAKADEHTYDDGVSKWDFKGRNGFWGPFEFKSKK